MEVALIEETCISNGCGVIFWITKAHYNVLEKSKRNFYCPSGHSMHYIGETDAQKIAAVQRDLTYYKNETARLEAIIAKKSKRKK